ncbi:MAG: adenylate/guanylate cyclase domain-containing protein [Aldersonia sp.]|nr:adenylate/guanylate cyclase domain-containing protein [Aldersonia sp.]
MSVSEIFDDASASWAWQEPACYTAGEAAAAAGVALPRARRYWRALGFPPSADNAVEFTASDVRMLRMMAGYVDEGLLDEPDSLRLTRLLSRAVAQLAKLQVEIVDSHRSHDSSTAPYSAERLAERIPEVHWLLGQMWKRQLGAAAELLDPVDPGRGDVPAETAVGFADIVGFTELSRARSQHELLRTVARFEYLVTDIVSECGGNVIKMLGDEVLFTADSAAAIADVATRLIAKMAGSAEIPALRVGLAWGPVMRQLGDVFGTTVNLASRLTRLAEPNTILVAPSIADALAGHPTFRLTPTSRRDVRGIGTMTPVQLDRR